MDEVKRTYEILVIGGSAGSLSMVLKLLPYFKKEMPLAVLIIFHRRTTEEDVLVDVLKSRTRCAVKELEDKDDLLPGTIYLAPPDYHLLIEKDKSVTLDDSEKVNYSRPSIDVTFESAAEVFKGNLACMLLSGANADGVEGLVYARTKDALIMIQDPVSAEVPFMPQQAVQRMQADLMIKPETLQKFSELLGL